jgi:hypothetical protein
MESRKRGRGGRVPAPRPGLQGFRGKRSFGLHRILPDPDGETIQADLVMAMFESVASKARTRASCSQLQLGFRRS